MKGDPNTEKSSMKFPYTAQLDPKK